MSPSIPLYCFVISCLAYVLARPILHFVHKASAGGSNLDQAEKGSLQNEEGLSSEELFQLEKRAFFGKVGSNLSFLFSLARSALNLLSDLALCVPPS
jgi:hypothetical protein